MSTKRTRAKPMEPEQRRRAIIAAVVPLLVENGPTITTRQIARAAGIAEGTVYRVFEDKLDLLLAAAVETINPHGGDQALVATLANAERLPDKMAIAVDHLRERMQKAMVVLVALRTESMKSGEGSGTHPGPPAFLAEANQARLAALTEHVFAPHRAELRMDPEQAALVLRSLVLGAWHPGTRDQAQLSTELIVDACLGGVRKGEC